MSTWMIYHVMLTLFVGAAALAVEGALVRWRLPARGAWVAALLAVVAVPIGMLLRGGSEAHAGATIRVGEATVLGAAGLLDWGAPAAEGAGLEADRLLLAVWIAGTLVCLAYLARGWFELRRMRGRWVREEVEGVPVWLAATEGPAVFGLVRSEIVVPRWALELDPTRRRLLLAHEREHVRAGDARLSAVAILLLAALPWNPALWWVVARLRSAIEMDCDRRVLAAEGDVRSYGSLLLEVGRRASGLALPVPAAAFGGGGRTLERRVRALVGGGRHRVLAGGAAVLAASALVAGAAALEPPPPPVIGLGGGLLRTGDPAEAAALPPPAPVTGAGVWNVPGTAETSVAADSAPVAPARPPAAPGAPLVPGGAARARASGTPSPARTPTSDFPVPPPPPAASAQPAPMAAPLRGPRPQLSPAPDTIPGPHFTPFEIRPQLLNRGDYGQELERGYPPALREAGIGGRVTMWVHIDAEGVVRETEVVNSSGNEELDRVAQEVMRETARFQPARLRGEPVAVWIQIPVTFQPR